MRVTDQMFFDLSTTQLRQQRARFARSQEQVLTGKSVLKPSDDGHSSARATRSRAQQLRAEGWQRSSNRGLALVETADVALDEAGALLQSARERALQGANDTLNATDREAIADEIDAMRAALVGIANSRDAEGYVFGGYQLSAAPFDDNGNYLGNAGQRQLEVGPAGQRLAVGVPGSTVFGSSAGSVFTALTDLSTALRAGDSAAVAAGAAAIHAGHQQLLQGRAELGAQMQGLTIAQNVAIRHEDRAVASQSEAVGIDSFAATVELSRAQQALNEAIQIAAQLPPPSLISQR